MLNFREELNQIISIKLYGDEIVKEQAEFFLENLLNYFKTQSANHFQKGIELMFRLEDKKICVREYSGDDRKGEDIYHFLFSESKMARKVLFYIESKLISDGFLKTSTSSVVQHGCFKIKIV